MKKRVRRAGGEEDGWEVSAFRSHWITDMLLSLGVNFSTLSNYGIEVRGRWEGERT